MVRKLLLKNNQASSTDGMRSISFQDKQARSIRKACSLKCLRELDSDEEWLLDHRPITDAGNEAEILRSWLKTPEVYLEGRLVRMISMRVPVFTDLCLYLVGSLIIMCD
jgi:hypothetical protein